MTISADANFGPVATTPPVGAIVLSVGDDYQSIVQNAPEGATFWFEGGVHHLANPISPLNGQTFIGAEGAVLDGSRELSGFTQESGYFVVGGQTQEGLRNATTEGAVDAVRAGYPESVFVDGSPLSPVANLADLKAGHFYFDYDNDKIYLADNPQGHLVEAGVSPGAFASDATGVTISNLTIEQFDAPIQRAAIQGAENWTVQNNEVRLNYGVGVAVGGNSKVVGNDIHDNGQMGIGGGGGDNILVEGNEIHSNGFWSGIDVYWEGGGTKFAETNNLVVRDNYSHDNHGFGLWTDIDNINTLYEGNLVVNNDGGGINHEISYDAVIRDNTLIGNGADMKGTGWVWGSQIQLQNSQNVDVYDNRIDMSGGLNGIGLIQQDRGTGAYGERTTTNNTVHDNLLVSDSTEGASGANADFNEQGLLNGGNVFSQNEYHMPDGDHWFWGLSERDDWASFAGQDGQGAGSVLSSTPIDTSSWLTDGSTTTAPDVSNPATDTGSQTAPVDAQPDPVDAQPDPVTTSPQPDPVDAQPDPIDAQPDAATTPQPDPVDAQPQSDPVQAGSDASGASTPTPAPTETPATGGDQSNAAPQTGWQHWWDYASSAASQNDTSASPTADAQDGTVGDSWSHDGSDWSHGWHHGDHLSDHFMQG